MQQIKDVIRSRLQAITYFVQFVFKYSNPKKTKNSVRVSMSLLIISYFQTLGVLFKKTSQP